MFLSTQIYNIPFNNIDGIVIIPQEKVIDILEKSEKLINTESQVRKAIREGMDPQEAYIKYSVF